MRRYILYTEKKDGGGEGAEAVGIVRECERKCGDQGALAEAQ